MSKLKYDSHRTIPIDVLSDLLALDADSGKLFWKTRPIEYFTSNWNTAETQCRIWNTRYAGKEAFTTKSIGYFHGSLFDMKIRAHVVVFALYNGHWPENTVDHINGNRLDNRPTNLRDVAHSHNIQNQHRCLPRSKTGVRGVFQAPSGRFVAQIRAEGIVYHLGTFDSVTLAEAAYLEAKLRYHNCPATPEHCSQGKY